MTEQAQPDKAGEVETPKRYTYEYVNEVLLKPHVRPNGEWIKSEDHDRIVAALQAAFDTLRIQLAQARNNALEEAAQLAEHAADNDDPYCCYPLSKEIASNIRDLKSPTSAEEREKDGGSGQFGVGA